MGASNSESEYRRISFGGCRRVKTFTSSSSGFYNTGYGTLTNLFNNILLPGSSSNELVVLTKSNNYWFVGIEFSTAQIVTKYRIWPRYDASTSNQNPNAWELRAATDSSTYNGGAGTYTVLDSQTNATFSSYSINGSVPASDNLSYANEYNLSTIGSYKYYVLHFTQNNGNANYITISELGLYGGGFVLPSQVGNAGKFLKTDGIELEWADLSINNLSDVDTSTNAPTDGQALVYDATAGNWKPGTVATTSSSTSVSLEDINDVSISSTPTNGQTLVYNSTSGQWEPGNGTVDVNTQEYYAIAGAGGTASFTTNVSSSHDSNHSGDNLHDNNIRDDSYDFKWVSNNTSFSSSGTGQAWVSYEFNTPQIVTKYRLWPRYKIGSNGFNEAVQNIRVWELRAATDLNSYTRSNSSTYTVLDSQSLPGTIDATGAASSWKN